MRFDRLHRAYPSLPPFGVVHWLAILLNTTATGFVTRATLSCVCRNGCVQRWYSWRTAPWLCCCVEALVYRPPEKEIGWLWNVFYFPRTLQMATGNFPWNVSNLHDHCVRPESVHLLAFNVLLVYVILTFQRVHYIKFNMKTGDLYQIRCKIAKIAKKKVSNLRCMFKQSLALLKKSRIIKLNRDKIKSIFYTNVRSNKL